MNQNDRHRLRIITLVKAGALSQRQAADRLNVSTRQVRRLVKAYEKDGDRSVIHKARGKTSNNRTPEEAKSKVLTIVRSHYPDFGPTLAREKLLERHGISIGVSTLRNWMVDAHIIEPRHDKRRRIYARRERRSCYGELVQIDGSYHDWFEGRAPKCCLIVAVDDATSKILYLRFVEHESLSAYFQAVEWYLHTHGKPLAFYTDRLSVFSNNGSDDPKRALTQFGRALNELGIEHIMAHSAQAKGRVERTNGVLQDRLIKEMRLLNLSSIDEGNRYLSAYIEQHNAKFGKTPASPIDAHQAIDFNCNLKRTLCPHYERKVAKDLSISFNGKTYQLDVSTIAPLRSKTVTVVVRRDGVIEVLLRDQVIPATLAAGISTSPSLLVEPIETDGTPPKSKTFKPGKHHPWRRWIPLRSGMQKHGQSSNSYCVV